MYGETNQQLERQRRAPKLGGTSDSRTLSVPDSPGEQNPPSHTIHTHTRTYTHSSNYIYVCLHVKSQGRNENNNLLSLYALLPLRGDDAENHSADTNECYMTALVTSYVCARGRGVLYMHTRKQRSSHTLPHPSQSPRTLLISAFLPSSFCFLGQVLDLLPETAHEGMN